MSLFIDIVVFVFLALLGLEFSRRLVRRFVPRAKEIHFDVAYLLFVVLGAYLYFPKATDEEGLRRSLTATERDLSTTKQELDATKKASLQTKHLLEGTRNDLNNAVGEVAILQKNAADARAGHQKVETELAKQLERTAIAERSLLKLQDRLAWRDLQSKQQETIVAKLKTFSGVDFEMRVFQEPEALSLLNILVEVLHSAGWVQRPIEAALEISTKYGAAGMTLAAGLQIRTDRRHPQLRNAAINLAAALMAEGIEAAAAETALERRPERIHIAVGKNDKRTGK